MAASEVTMWALRQLHSDGEAGDKRLKVPMPETVLWSQGAPVRWYFTSESGGLLRRHSKRLNSDQIMKYFQRHARKERENSKPKINDGPASVPGRPSVGVAHFKTADGGVESRLLDLESVGDLLEGDRKHRTEQRNLMVLQLHTALRQGPRDNSDRIYAIEYRNDEASAVEPLTEEMEKVIKTLRLDPNGRFSIWNTTGWPRDLKRSTQMEGSGFRSRTLTASVGHVVRRLENALQSEAKEGKPKEGGSKNKADPVPGGPLPQVLRKVVAVVFFNASTCQSFLLHLTDIRLETSPERALKPAIRAAVKTGQVGPLREAMAMRMRSSDEDGPQLTRPPSAVTFEAGQDLEPEAKPKPRADVTMRLTKPTQSFATWSTSLNSTVADDSRRSTNRPSSASQRQSSASQRPSSGKQRPVSATATARGTGGVGRGHSQGPQLGAQQVQHNHKHTKSSLARDGRYQFQIQPITSPSGSPSAGSPFGGAAAPMPLRTSSTHDLTTQANKVDPAISKSKSATAMGGAGASEASGASSGVMVATDPRTISLAAAATARGARKQAVESLGSDTAAAGFSAWAPVEHREEQSRCWGSYCCVPLLSSATCVRTGSGHGPGHGRGMDLFGERGEAVQDWRLPYKSLLCARAEDTVVGESLLEPLARACASAAIDTGHPEMLHLAALFERASASAKAAEAAAKGDEEAALVAATEAAEATEAAAVAEATAARAVEAMQRAEASGGSVTPELEATGPLLERALRQTVKQRFGNLDNYFHDEALATFSADSRQRLRTPPPANPVEFARAARGSSMKQVREYSLGSTVPETTDWKKDPNRRMRLWELEDAERAACYMNALGYTHPSRYYRAVPLCAVCFLVYSTLDSYRTAADADRLRRRKVMTSKNPRLDLYDGLTDTNHLPLQLDEAPLEVVAGVAAEDPLKIVEDVSAVLEDPAALPSQPTSAWQESSPEKVTEVTLEPALGSPFAGSKDADLDVLAELGHTRRVPGDRQEQHVMAELDHKMWSREGPEQKPFARPEPMLDPQTPVPVPAVSGLPAASMVATGPVKSRGQGEEDQMLGSSIDDGLQVLLGKLNSLEGMTKQALEASAAATAAVAEAKEAELELAPQGPKGSQPPHRTQGIHAGATGAPADENGDADETPRKAELKSQLQDAEARERKLQRRLLMLEPQKNQWADALGQAKATKVLQQTAQHSPSAVKAAAFAVKASATASAKASAAMVEPLFMTRARATVLFHFIATGHDADWWQRHQRPGTGSSGKKRPLSASTGPNRPDVSNLELTRHQMSQAMRAWRLRRATASREEQELRAALKVLDALDLCGVGLEEWVALLQEKYAQKPSRRDQRARDRRLKRQGSSRSIVDDEGAPRPIMIGTQDLVKALAQLSACATTVATETAAADAVGRPAWTLQRSLSGGTKMALGTETLSGADIDVLINGLGRVEDQARSSNGMTFSGDVYSSSKRLVALVTVRDSLSKAHDWMVATAKVDGQQPPPQKQQQQQPAESQGGERGPSEAVSQSRSLSRAPSMPGATITALAEETQSAGAAAWAEEWAVQGSVEQSAAPRAWFWGQSHAHVAGDAGQALGEALEPHEEPQDVPWDETHASQRQDYEAHADGENVPVPEPAQEEDPVQEPVQAGRDPTRTVTVEDVAARRRQQELDTTLEWLDAYLRRSHMRVSDLFRTTHLRKSMHMTFREFCEAIHLPDDDSTEPRDTRDGDSQTLDFEDLHEEDQLHHITDADIDEAAAAAAEDAHPASASASAGKEKGGASATGTLGHTDMNELVHIYTRDAPGRGGKQSVVDAGAAATAVPGKQTLNGMEQRTSSSRPRSAKQMPTSSRSGTSSSTGEDMPQRQRPASAAPGGTVSSRRGGREDQNLESGSQQRRPSSESRKKRPYVAERQGSGPRASTAPAGQSRSRSGVPDPQDQRQQRAQRESKREARVLRTRSRTARAWVEASGPEQQKPPRPQSASRERKSKRRHDARGGAQGPGEAEAPELVGAAVGPSLAQDHKERGGEGGGPGLGAGEVSFLPMSPTTAATVAAVVQLQRATGVDVATAHRIVAEAQETQRLASRQEKQAYKESPQHATPGSKKPTTQTVAGPGVGMQENDENVNLLRTQFRSTTDVSPQKPPRVLNTVPASEPGLDESTVSEAMWAGPKFTAPATTFLPSTSTVTAATMPQQRHLQGSVVEESPRFPLTEPQGLTGTRPLVPPVPLVPRRELPSGAYTGAF